jgi:sugar lactone lactonase YvrE
MYVPQVAEPPARLARAEVVASWPDGTFLENLVFAPGGALYVTAYAQGEIHRVDVAAGTRQPFVRPGFFPLGIANDGHGGFVVSGHRQPGFEPRAQGSSDGFWQIAADGCVRPIGDAPAARFLNGLTALGNGRFACADSSGALWTIDLAGDVVQRVSTCETLQPVEPEAPLPAANGLKVRGAHLYVSNWVKATVVRAPLTDLSRFEVVHRDVVIDDFDFDARGNLYGATHMRTVVCIDRDGQRHTVGGPGQGVHGATACVVGPDGALYVVTDGGTVAHHLGFAPALEPARLVRLHVAG